MKKIKEKQKAQEEELKKLRARVEQDSRDAASAEKRAEEAKAEQTQLDKKDKAMDRKKQAEEKNKELEQIGTLRRKRTFSTIKYSVLEPFSR